MSHTCFHYPHSFELVPLDVTPPSERADNVFSLKLRQRANSDWQHLLPIYVSREVEELYRAGVVRGIYVHALPAGGTGMRSLPGLPAYVVLGVELKDGTRRNTVPAELRRVRLRSIAAATAVLVAGVAAGTLAPWVGGCLVALSTHALRTASSVYKEPF